MINLFFFLLFQYSMEKNIIIGDSQTPFVDINTQKAKRVPFLCQGGVDVKWLVERINLYPVDSSVRNVIVVIGTNGVFGKYRKDNVEGLFKGINFKFPNTRILVVQGSWGWTRGNYVSEQFVRNYYEQYKKHGAVLIEPPIGQIEPHQNHPVYKIIGKKLDQILK